MQVIILLFKQDFSYKQPKMYLTDSSHESGRKESVSEKATPQLKAQTLWELFQ